MKEEVAEVEKKF